VLQVSWLRGHRHHRAAAGCRDYRHSALLLLLLLLQVMEQATGGTRSSVVQLSLERRCRCRVRRLDGLVVVARVLLVHRRATSLGH